MKRSILWTDCLTLQISSLFLAKHGAHFANARGKRDLEVLGHDLFALVDAALLLGLADHCVYALNGLLAFLEEAGDGLGDLLNLALLALLDILVIEARKHVLLVQLVELPRLLCDFGQVLGDLVLHVEPARRQEVHFYNGIAVVLEGGNEALALLGDAAAVAKAIGARGAVASLLLLLGMVRVRLAVRDEARWLRQQQRGSAALATGHTGWFGPATCWAGAGQRGCVMVGADQRAMDNGQGSGGCEWQRTGMSCCASDMRRMQSWPCVWAVVVQQGALPEAAALAAPSSQQGGTRPAV
jgi:hypothetical protein